MDEKPSRNEDEYFKKQDAELIAAQRNRLDAERSRVERSMHYMKCPKCGGNLVEQSFHQVKIDTCPDCKGIWLDAGELDLISRIDQSRLGGFARFLFGLGK